VIALRSSNGHVTDGRLSRWPLIWGPTSHGKFNAWLVRRARPKTECPLRGVDIAQSLMALDARLAVARRVIAQMALIERQRDGANGAIDLQKAVLRQATADKRAVEGYKA
jgi:hypothetical protein